MRKSKAVVNPKANCEGLLINIPSNVENLALPDPTLLQYYIDQQNRIVWLEGEVDGSCIEIAKQIIKWNAEDKDTEVKKRKPIKLFAFSPGGDLDVHNALVDVIKLSKTPVYGINIGLAASAACFVFMSCHKRYALKNSYFLLHQGSAENINGTFAQVVAAVEDYQTKIEQLFKYILENSKIPKDELEERIYGEWYMSAEEAVKYGVCDEIVTDINTIL